MANHGAQAECRGVFSLTAKWRVKEVDSTSLDHLRMVKSFLASITKVWRRIVRAKRRQQMRMVRGQMVIDISLMV
jgi:hypothetical protein